MDKRFTIEDTPLASLKVITRKQMGDHRGFLSRIFCTDELREASWMAPIAQINHTYTQKKGTVRGLHFQYAPHQEMKLVSCLQGEIYDVAVDIRKDSPTFLQWFGVRLSAKNNQALLIPEGFAHGFQTLAEDVALLYCHSKPHASQAEGGLHPEDTSLNISWPLSITALSDRDNNHKLITSEFKGI